MYNLSFTPPPENLYLLHIKEVQLALVNKNWTRN